MPKENHIKKSRQYTQKPFHEQYRTNVQQWLYRKKKKIISVLYRLKTPTSKHKNQKQKNKQKQKQSKRKQKQNKVQRIYLCIHLKENKNKN